MSITATDHRWTDVVARRAAQPAGRARRRALRPVRRRRSAPHRPVVGAADGAGPAGAACAEKPSARQAIDLRATIRASRTTGWEPVRLARTRRRTRPRPVVLVCDVSRSMQPYATIYLHLMRAAAVVPERNPPGDLRIRDVSDQDDVRVVAPLTGDRARPSQCQVTDRFGGTHLGRCIGELLSPPHGNALRGAVVIIASDGWDSDPPEVLDRALARLRRRAAPGVWVNPRMAQRGFQPLTGSMAAALPYCDLPDSSRFIERLAGSVRLTGRRNALKPLPLVGPVALWVQSAVPGLPGVVASVAGSDDATA